MTSLYKISEEFDRLLSAYQEAETDEAQEVALKELTLMDKMRDEKLANCCAYVKNLTNEMQDVEEEIARFMKEVGELREKVTWYKNRIGRFEDYVTSCMQPSEKWTNGPHKIGWRASERCEILNEADIPPQYMNEKVIRSLDKVGALRDMKLGVIIPGCAILKKNNIQIK